MAGPAPVRFPLVSLLAFVRIGTSPRVFERPLGPADAIGIVTRWLQRPFTALASPTSRHWTVLAETMTGGQVSGPAAADAHLAALTMEHGGVLHTSDRGFARYPGLRFANPLAA
jgi:toxin-antitoxin system PIN domain toxin